MRNIKKIEASLSRIVDLLIFGENYEWARALKRFENEIENTPDATSSKILSIFGGMGSFNDIVLYKNGQPLIPENNELFELRSILYDLCRESRNGPARFEDKPVD